MIIFDNVHRHRYQGNDNNDVEEMRMITRRHELIAIDAVIFSKRAW